MMVMQCAENGNLRQRLNYSFNSMKWGEKLDILRRIAMGLENIHDKGLVHCNFHCGNILNSYNNFTLISDLELCRPANLIPSQDDYKKIYGVLPYVAPEVLREGEYTQKSDIYAFGIIAYEVYTGLPPYHDIAHDKILAISICQGLRPKSSYKIPQVILDIIKQCWDADPLKRPYAGKFRELLDDVNSDEFNKQSEEADKINEKLTSTLSYTTNPHAVYTSRLLDFKNLPEPKNAIVNKDDDNSIQLENIQNP
ncbi:kinase-like domain-containing protein [Rhizophagus irregularis DAOM 181602=DAOM 197198]|uniref:Cdc15p n=2 Tax=Rhizophagus irregularis TaxID=588596 RepID=A0A015IB84_RHIIW|nr:kinase-like domain-containing protein [Rhizophagus irregularis DAOM 181602=DAOM 197198]EXX54462.1 Cdc15p [Rhizophagus irregularis DAOM 197198w]POG82128.1 kinase-like domain-containing protein [Rhizophagus irregularis DAOM 181602=DAOM 197198]|eukprot:XP_025188994.1 kinase-like domain-containing protein [Rhizophagus irregularis DAOM 181602=DAOM 197198]